MVRDRPCDNTGASRLFGVTDFGERCNEKDARNEETNFVRWMVKIVRCIPHASPNGDESVGHPAIQISCIFLSRVVAAGSKF